MNITAIFEVNGSALASSYTIHYQFIPGFSELSNPMGCLTQGRKTRYNNQQLDELVPSLQFSVQKIDRLSSSIVSFAFLHAVQCLSYCNRWYVYSQ